MKHKIAKNQIPISIQLLLRLALVMLCYSISRLCFFAFNFHHFSNVGWSDFWLIMRGGLIFDRTAMLYTNALVILLMILPFKFRFNKVYQLITHWVFIVCNCICLLINTADIAYYEFTMRRTTATIFLEFQHDNNLSQIFKLALFDHIGVSLSAIASITLFIFGAQKIKYAKNYISSNIIFYSSHVALLLIVAALFVGGVRGGFKHSTRPITLSNASKYISEPNQRAVVLNTPFAIIRTLGKNSLEKPSYFSSEELQHYFNAEHEFCMGDSSFSKPNVVVIILYRGIQRLHPFSRLTQPALLFLQTRFCQWAKINRCTSIYHGEYSVY